MGEREETGRLPGEIVEVYRAPRRSGETRDPREIVEVYRPPDPREVVEVYRRPVPPRRAARTGVPVPGAGRRRTKSGLWKFLACLTLLAGLALAGTMAEDYFLSPRWDEDPDLTSQEDREITIPSGPWARGRP